PPAVQGLRLVCALRRRGLGLRVVLLEPAGRLVVRIEPRCARALAEPRRALARQRPLASHGPQASPWHSPAVFDHVTIRVSDRAAAERFYDTVLPSVGLDESRRFGQYTLWGDFSIVEAGADEPVTRGLHVGFFAPSHDVFDASCRGGPDAGDRAD